MEIIMGHAEQTEGVPLIQQVRLSRFRRAKAWLFSQEHFHLKLLFGTGAGVAVILLLAGIFLFVTIRSHRHEQLRSRTVDLIRLSSLVENDIASLEAAHRGFLLSADQSFVAQFRRQQELINTRLDDLGALIVDDPQQRKRLVKVQEVTRQWVDTVATADIRSQPAGAAAPSKTKESTGQSDTGKLGASLLDQARSALQSFQDEKQIVLNQRMLEQDWASQSTQIL